MPAQEKLNPAWTFTICSSQYLMIGPWPPFLRTFTEKGLQLWLYSLLEVSFSRTWEPLLWNVIIRKDRASVYQSLWEDKILTSKLPANKHGWPILIYKDQLCNFSLLWLYWGLLFPHPSFSLKWPKSPLHKLEWNSAVSPVRSHWTRSVFIALTNVQQYLSLTPDTASAGTLILYLPASKTVQNKSLLFKPPSLWYLVIMAWVH